MVMPSISSPNLWLKWKSPLVLVSPFRVSRENLIAMVVSPLLECVEGDYAKSILSYMTSSVSLT